MSEKVAIRRIVGVNAFQRPVPEFTVGLGQIDGDDIDVKFDAAQRFIDAHWAQFDDPNGVAADLDELRLAVSGTRPANRLRTQLTVHRLRRTAGNAAPVAAVIALVREMLGTA
jgi:hypothetical protein